MYKIGIVDDFAVWSKMAYEYVNEYVLNKKLNCTVEVPEDIWNLDELKKYDLLFLDIDLGKEKTGFDVAEELQKRNPESKIIFWTSHEEWARDGYKVQAFRYLDKSKMDEIPEAIEAFMDVRGRGEMIDLRIRNVATKRIEISKILYFETKGRTVFCYLKNGKVLDVTNSLGQLEEGLKSKNFIKVQRSCLVNVAYIEDLDSRHLYMINGKAIAVGRKSLEEVRSVFMDWKLIH